MRLDRSLTLRLFLPLQRLGWRSRGARLPILMYHRISANPEPTLSPYYQVCTSPERFNEQMDWLAATGWRGVTLSEGLAALHEHETQSKEQGAKHDRLGDLAAPDGISGAPSSQLPAPNSRAPGAKKLVAITFDDGFRDFHTSALPSLQAHGFAATMYVPTAFIGDARRSFKTHDCMTWQELADLVTAGMEVGSHTVTHPRLAALSRPEIEAELRDSKATIEQRLGVAVPSFAYPYAFPQENRHFARDFREILKQCGYRSCVTTAIGRARDRDDSLHLPRLPANSADDHALFMAKLAGAYDWLALPQMAGKFSRHWLGLENPPANSAGNRLSR